MTDDLTCPVCGRQTLVRSRTGTHTVVPPEAGPIGPGRVLAECSRPECDGAAYIDMTLLENAHEDEG